MIISIKLKKEFESNILLCECVIKNVICKSPLNINSNYHASLIIQLTVINACYYQVIIIHIF